MKSRSSHPTPRQYLDKLLAAGRHTFTTAEAQAALSLSRPTLKVALYRLARQKLIVSPVRSFYMILPPEHRSLGSLPPDQFVPSLMDTLRVPYYAGLLTAAQYHGAAHQRPQEFQVLVEKPRRRIVCGRVRVVFFVRKNLREVPTESFNTPRGTIVVSTPEATALDLVGYQHRVGGVNHVATVLSELAEALDADRLVRAAEAAPVSWAQRLGYLLELAADHDKTGPLKQYVRARARESTALLPGKSRAKASRHEEWKLFVNTAVEIDL